MRIRYYKETDSLYIDLSKKIVLSLWKWPQV